jgi:predicted nucleic-acid-binding Zn-ribbon protein
VDNQISPFPPCPKCGDEQRRGVGGLWVGLWWEAPKSDVIVCFSCGYLEFYARPETLAEIKRLLGSALARDFEKSWAERPKQAEKPQ